MSHKFLRTLTAGALTLFSVAPAFALCNPGTPNCVTDGGPGSRLAKAKHEVFDPGQVGGGEWTPCKNGEGCGTPYRKAVIATQPQKPVRVK